MGTTTGPLRCAICGEGVRRGRTGAYGHRARLVAACDLDSDHRVVVDWDAYGPLACRRCAATVVARGAGYAHADPAADADHPADPDLPAG